MGLGLGYGLAPLGWGYGGWGLGALAYNSGYLGYSNPYYNGSFGGYNYAQPIPVDYGVSPTAVVAEGNPADAALNAAVAAFKQNDYDAALDIINKGIAQYPTDSVMHEFRGLVLFAKGDYQQAAATIHSVLAIGPGWDWTTLASLYTNIVIYTDQLRALEAFVREHPQDGASRFLLGYHYMTAGHADAAAQAVSAGRDTRPRRPGRRRSAEDGFGAADRASRPRPQNSRRRNLPPRRSRPPPPPPRPSIRRRWWDRGRQPAPTARSSS